MDEKKISNKLSSTGRLTSSHASCLQVLLGILIIGLISVINLIPFFDIRYTISNQYKTYDLPFFHISFDEHFNSSAYHSRCLIYDKAPRTGSSTISNALRSCWMSQNYSIPQYISKTKFNASLTEMIDKSNDRVAFAGSHLGIPPTEIDQLLQNCQSVMYITSTRSMPFRIASKAKYEVSTGRTYLNTSLSTIQMKNAWDIALQVINGEEDEKRMERYPFQGTSIKPDYIIRDEYFEYDLSSLLKAFDCSESFFSKNLHIYEPNSTAENVEQKNVKQKKKEDDEPVDFSKLPIKFQNHRHNVLLDLAATHNERGLERARVFRQSIN